MPSAVPARAVTHSTSQIRPGYLMMKGGRLRARGDYPAPGALGAWRIRRGRGTGPVGLRSASCHRPSLPAQRAAGPYLAGHGGDHQHGEDFRERHQRALVRTLATLIACAMPCNAISTANAGIN